MEKKIVPLLITPPRRRRDGAILDNPFGNKRKTRIAFILLGFLCLAAASLFAAEPAKQESALKEIASIEKRGIVNFLTTPSEVVYTFKTEKSDHPKAWPLTYVPRFFAKAATRVGSSVYDIMVLPWYVRQAKDDTPLTRRFDLPDYAWQKE